MLTYKQYYYLKEQFILESFKDVLIIWSKSNDKEEVKLYIDKFKSLRSKNQLEGENKDISNWMNKDFNDFKDYVNKKEEEYQEKIPLKKKAKDKDYPIVFENDKVEVRLIKSKAASCKLGSDTDWCVSKQNGRYWEDYVDEQDMTFYFILKKQPEGNAEDKFAINVYPDSFRKKVLEMDEKRRKEQYNLEKYYLDDNILCQIWNKPDINVSANFKQIINKYGVPISLFKPFIDPDIKFVRVKNKKFKYKEEDGVKVYQSIDISGMELTEIPDFN